MQGGAALMYTVFVVAPTTNPKAGKVQGERFYWVYEEATQAMNDANNRVGLPVFGVFEAGLEIYSD